MLKYIQHAFARNNVNDTMTFILKLLITEIDVPEEARVTILEVSIQVDESGQERYLIFSLLKGDINMCSELPVLLIPHDPRHRMRANQRSASEACRHMRRNLRP